MAGGGHDVGPDRDHPPGSQGQKRQGDVVVSAEQTKIVGQVAGDLHRIGDVAAGLLDPADVGVPGQPGHRLHRDRAAGPPGDIVQNHRYVHPVGHIGKMAVHSLGVGLDVVRGDAQKRVRPHFRVLHAFFQLGFGGVGAAARNHRHPARHPVDGVAADRVVLLMAHGGGFPGGTQHQDSVGSLFNLPVNQLAQPFKMYRPVRMERGNQRYNRSLQIHPSYTPFIIRRAGPLIHTLPSSSIWMVKRPFGSKTST